jgi:hypothetical protein
MHQNLNSASQNVVHHTANVNHAVLCGHSADCIVTATKRLLGRKRLPVPASYGPEISSSGSMRMPGRGGQRRLVTSGDQPDVRMFPESGTRPWTAGDTPAAIWAALIITRALSS